MMAAEGEGGASSGREAGRAQAATPAIRQGSARARRPAPVAGRAAPGRVDRRRLPAADARGGHRHGVARHPRPGARAPSRPASSPWLVSREVAGDRYAGPDDALGGAPALADRRGRAHPAGGARRRAARADPPGDRAGRPPACPGGAAVGRHRRRVVDAPAGHDRRPRRRARAGARAARRRGGRPSPRTRSVSAARWASSSRCRSTSCRRSSRPPARAWSTSWPCRRPARSSCRDRRPARRAGPAAGARARRGGARARHGRQAPLRGRRRPARGGRRRSRRVVVVSSALPRLSADAVERMSAGCATGGRARRGRRGCRSAALAGRSPSCRGRAHRGRDAAAGSPRPGRPPAATGSAPTGVWSTGFWAERRRRAEPAPPNAGGADRRVGPHGVAGPHDRGDRRWRRRSPSRGAGCAWSTPTRMRPRWRWPWASSRRPAGWSWPAGTPTTGR